MEVMTIIFGGDMNFPHLKWEQKLPKNLSESELSRGTLCKLYVCSEPAKLCE